MKKLIVGFMALLLLTGCHQSQKINYFMLTNEQKLSALYNSKGKQITDYEYQSFQKVGSQGYIVTNAKKQVGYISLDGEEIIPMGEYETLQSVDDMFYATKKVEKDNKDTKEKSSTNQFVNENLYVLDKEGNLLYQADESTAIMPSDLPVIKKGKEYIVLYQNGEELYRGQEAVRYVCQYSSAKSVIIGFKEKNQFYYNVKDKEKCFDIQIDKGDYQFLIQNENGCIVNDEKLKSMIYIDFTKKKAIQNQIAIKDAYYDEKGNIILTSNDKTYIYPVGGVPILINTYYFDSKTYLVREESVYGPHHIYQKGVSTGALENCQLYPEVQELQFEVFPVYIQNKGYVYYGFDNKQAIEQTYVEAYPFDASHTAIVKENNKGYSLIDENGQILTKNTYYRMKYIGSSYYAVYNEAGMYGIIDTTGEEIFPIEYTYLPEMPIIEYEEENYLMLNKNGRTYVYDINNEMEELFSVEGDLIFHKEGYFSNEYHYYTIEGESIE